KIIDDKSIAFNGLTKKKIKNYKIPSKVTIDGKKYTVTSIAKNAFKGSKIKSVTIPKSVTIIESNAFAYCNKLTSVIIPAGVKTIQSKAFSGCKALGTVIFKGNTNVKPKAFVDIKKGASFKVPKKLVKIYEKSLPKCGAKKYKLKQT
ncbi:MAG: leucine-rich repeat domain-containing protein, partial [Clostridiales bacterium]|nr:leucine-rich repeat domain-containing protein [Clostridiales bacterium]